jgi:kynurenine formamidase/cytochrome c5
MRRAGILILIWIAHVGLSVETSAQDASQLFSENCAVCHGPNGRGAVKMPNLPDFTDPAFHKSRTDEQLIESVTNGKGLMTPFGDALKPEEIRKLVAYVRSFSKGSPSTAEGLLERAFRGQARIIDLTHKINQSVPTFGGERDAMQYEKLADFDKEGYRAGAFRLPEHFGTHVDAPGHFIPGQPSVDQIEPARLLIPAAVIDVRDKVRENPDYRLTVADIQVWERDGPLPQGAAVLLLTGWGERFSDPAKYRNADAKGLMHFPGFSPEAVSYLVSKGVVALGIDTLSIDYGPSKDFAAHKLSHQNGLYHLENLANLDKLPPRGSVIFVGVLPIGGGSGSPARVLALAP